MARFAIYLLGLSMCICSICVAGQAQTRAGSSPVEELAGQLPDKLLGFIATSGGDSLEPAFENSNLGKLWKQPSVQAFYQSLKNGVFSNLKAALKDNETRETFEIASDLAKLAVSRPMMMGVGQQQVSQGLEVYGFLIMDAGQRQDQIAAAIGKLEALADEGDIVDVNVASVKMHTLIDNNGPPVSWGWVGNYFVVTVNDQTGLIVQQLSGQHSATTKPAHLTALAKVPATGDVVAMYLDCQAIAQAMAAKIAAQQGDETLAKIKEALKQLGLISVKTLVARSGFVGLDFVSDASLTVAGPRTGLLACFRPINLSDFDMVHAGTSNASVIDCDLAGIYDTVIKTIAAVAPQDVKEYIEQRIDEWETEMGFKLRDGLLESLGGPVVCYSMPNTMAGLMPVDAMAVIVKANNPALLENILIAAEKFIAANSEGMLQIQSQIQDERTLHFWMVTPLAMMQVLPCWTIVQDKLLIVSNRQIYNDAVEQITSPDAAKNSIRTTESYKQVASNLPANLISFQYSDSKVQVEKMMSMAQQYWPIVTMQAKKQADMDLPFLLPPTDDIVRHVGSSCQYSWFDSDGFGSHSQGGGAMSIAGTAGVAGVAGLFSAMTMPALGRAREMAKRSVSSSNLRLVGVACVMYANEHNGKYPETTDTLVASGHLTDQILESPLKPKGFAGPSYIYIAGQNADSYPENILAYENPAYSSQGVNVLHADGHAQWMGPSEFLQKLEATYTRLGKKMPQINFKSPTTKPSILGFWPLKTFNITQDKPTTTAPKQKTLQPAE